MGELYEFAEALIDQIAVELDEEKEIAHLSSQISDDPDFTVKFDTLEKITAEIFPESKLQISKFTNLNVADSVTAQFPDLINLKLLKGKKVFSTKDARSFVDDLFEAISREDKSKIVDLIKKDTAKFITYSTYAKSYISKISTTYGDYMDSTIYLNNFILSRYPKIILYKQGAPYQQRFDTVNAGYRGALKMTVLEELIHSVQDNLYQINKQAVIQVNELNEELATIILALDDQTAKELTDYLQLQTVPDDFPIARRANLFFMLNPDNFIMNVLGPDVLTFTRVQIDPKIAKYIPELSDIYQRWLAPIQTHHAAFSIMEGMAEFCIQNILASDSDFEQYLQTFMGTDISAYRLRKNMGRDFVGVIYDTLGTDTFSQIIKTPPTTRELKNPQLYLKNHKIVQP